MRVRMSQGVEGRAKEDGEAGFPLSRGPSEGLDPRTMKS